MARKAAVAPDTKSDLIERLGEFSQFKNLDRATMMSVLEEILRTMIRRRYETDENFQVIINPDKGDIEIYRERTVVNDSELEDESRQISLSEAKQLDEDLDVGDPWAEKIEFKEFGLRQVMAAKQLLAQKIKDLEKSLVFNDYKARVGEVIVGEVYQIWRNETLVLHEGNEVLLPKSEQIPKDFYKKGDTIRAVVLDVEMRNANPKVIISRAAPEFLAKLFELEVPEIYDGLITIKGIVREPGERAKVAVESYDDRIDPVGACVGMRGTRIHGIVRELRQENIDVIAYSPNHQIYIQRSLGPARVSNIVVDELNKRAEVHIKGDQIALAIGKGGVNVKLASRLTGFELDVFREDDPTDMAEEDVDLDEFADEIEPEVLEKLKAIGCDTAKSVLALTMPELVRRTQLEESTLQAVREILQKEFEE